MKTMSARVLDPKHLELAEPLQSAKGEWIQIVVSDDDTTNADRQRAAEERFLSAYAEEDAVYDDL